MMLSILIPTLPERFVYYQRIYSILFPQVNKSNGQVQLVPDNRGREIPTGRKRNELIQHARGKYVVFVDDDDWVPDYYVEEILKAAQNDSDCITFRGWMTTDGRSRVNFVLRKGEKYEERNGVYYRWPNHITPIKKSIAQIVKFPQVTVGEDYRWSKEINDRGLIKSETFIDKEMYHYDYKTFKGQNKKYTTL